MASREPSRRLAARARSFIVGAGVGVAAAALCVPSCTHGWDELDPRLTGEGVGIGGTGGTGGAGSSAGGGPGPGGSSASASASSGGGAGGGRPLCGNGFIEAGEECDDENAVTGDGCDDCAVECSAQGEIVDPTTFHCYLFGPSLTWQASVDACADWGGHLAAVTDDDELAFVLSQVTQQIWLGASELAQEDVWVWVSGEPWAYAPWLTGEPNEGSGGAGGGLPYDEDCLELFDEAGAVEGYGFADDGCAHEQPALCERWPAGQTR
ncbi:MAG: lectin-like protein [Polyangiaceae bacterium]